ncbi:Uncharacterised protein [Mycobacteroides abscessus subsp. abscessus]|nr:Uncharacterised protein [Mycobacteroides abscessus subsp. abscessus]
MTGGGALGAVSSVTRGGATASAGVGAASPAAGDRSSIRSPSPRTTSPTTSPRRVGTRSRRRAPGAESTTTAGTSPARVKAARAARGRTDPNQPMRPPSTSAPRPTVATRTSLSLSPKIAMTGLMMLVGVSGMIA